MQAYILSVTYRWSGLAEIFSNKLQYCISYCIVSYTVLDLLYMKMYTVKMCHIGQPYVCKRHLLQAIHFRT